MTSPEGKDQIKCINCELYKKEIQEKDAKIKILENNLLKIKSLLSESGSLIDGYNEIMEENKQLKIEIDKLKNSINKSSNDNYQFDLLKGKMLRFQQENEKLRSSIHFYESQKNQSLNSRNSNEIKIKRELSLKDKEINQLNTVISILKLKHNEQKNTNEDIIKNFNKGNGNNGIDPDELYFLDNNKDNINNNNDYNSENEFRSNINTNNNNIKMIDLFKEKEFLSDEYQRYKQKYIIYKFKYHEFKKTTKLFLNTMKIIPPGNNILDIFEFFNDKKNINLIGNKRLKEKEDQNLFNNIHSLRSNNKSNKKSEDNFKNILRLPSVDNDSYSDNDKDEKIDVKEDEEKSESVNKKNKSRKKITKSRNKKIKREKSEESRESKEKNGDDNNKDKKNNKQKTESKKRGRKPKKEKENTEQKNEIKKEIKEGDKLKDDKIQEIENKKVKNEENKENIQKEEKNLTIKEKEINNEAKSNGNKDGENKEDKNKSSEKKIIEEYIGPIQKNIKKKLDPIAQKTLNTNTLLNLLSNNPEKITEENLNSILSLQTTLHEKISFLFEVIISNLIQLELSRVLTLFEIFIDITPEDSKSLIGINILENINLHLNSTSLLNKKIHLKFMNKTNETYKTYITKNFTSPIFIVSFLIDIIFRKLNDVSSLSNFIFKLVFDKNIDEKNKSKMLIILNNTLKEKNMEDITTKKIYYKEEQYNRYTSSENENKFYFFLFYKSTLISNRIFNLILSIYLHESNPDINIDQEIISKLNDIFNTIPEEQELKIEIPNFPEEYKSSIKFNSNLFYLEIFQALNIIVEIRDVKWIAENIFTNVLWKNFQNSKKDSLKRALSIYYTSLLFYLCLKAGIKNHGSENLLEQIEFSRIYGWLYSIYNPQIQFENFIGFYERICALSWIVESPIMTMSTKVVDSIKEVVDKIINGQKESLCPSDFLDKIKKLKLI